ncbi:MAG TPA: hypothetical protein VNE62_11875 [Actinomycetota bacterium]|nr:hypothetical protein [Actinomycetota bacterium]
MAEELNAGPVPGRDIRTTAFFIADHAEAVNGKLYVLGGCWDVLSVRQLPAHHPHMSVATALHVPWGSTNQVHTITVRLIDEDGHPAGPEMSGQFETGRPPGMRPGDETTMLLAFNMVSTPLEREGRYEFVLDVDGTELARARFRVTVQPAQ